MRALLLIALVSVAGCEQFDVFVNATTDEGTVYECSAGEKTIEVCYLDDSAAELGDRLGMSCGDPSRRWPWLVNKLNAGCAYSCPSPRYGCNSKNSCYCPTEKPSCPNGVCQRRAPSVED